jgi:hypothetical protein
MADTYALLIVEFIFMVFLVIFLVKYYKSPEVGKDVVVSTFVSWTLGFAGIILLPYDVSVALVERTELSALKSLWDMIYWRYEFGFISDKH